MSRLIKSSYFSQILDLKINLTENSLMNFHKILPNYSYFHSLCSKTFFTFLFYQFEFLNFFFLKINEKNLMKIL